MRTFPFNPPASTGPDPELQQAEPLALVSLATGGEAYLITRYEDVRTAFSDPRFSRAAGAVPGTPTMMPGTQGISSMINLDPPEHSRLRRLVSQAFTARGVEQMRPQVESIVHRLLDEMTSPADLVRDFARPMPTTVISTILGVPVADSSVFYDWVMTRTSLDRPDPEVARSAAERAAAYLLDAIERRRLTPEGDMLTTLVQVHDQGGDRLTSSELIDTVLTLFTTGQETTANQLSSSVFFLLTQQLPVWKRLVADPALVPVATEELLRYVRPVEAQMSRVALEDVELSTGVVPAGSAVLPVAPVANRDPAVFADPDAFDIDRPDIGAHIAFGYGPHYCVGAALARLELQVALHALVTRTPALRLTAPAGSLRWNVETFMGGLLELPVTW